MKNNGFTNDERNLFFFFLFAMFIGTGVLLGNQGRTVASHGNSQGFKISEPQEGRVQHRQSNNQGKRKVNSGNVYSDKPGKVSRKSREKGSGKKYSGKADQKGLRKGKGKVEKIHFPSEKVEFVNAEESKNDAIVFPVDINKCEVSVLTRIPGIGNCLASRIRARIKMNQPIVWVEDLASIKGIGKQRAMRLAPYFGIKPGPVKLEIQKSGKRLIAETTVSHGCSVRNIPDKRKVKKGISGNEIQGRVDLNCADASTLEQVRGIGPVLARRIIEHRIRCGPFRSLRELREIRGISRRISLMAGKYLFCGNNTVDSVRVTVQAAKEREQLKSGIFSPAENKPSGSVKTQPDRKQSWNWKRGYRQIFQAFPELEG